MTLSIKRPKLDEERIGRGMPSVPVGYYVLKVTVHLRHVIEQPLSKYSDVKSMGT